MALIRDLRRQVSCAPAEEDPQEDSSLPAWWRENEKQLHLPGGRLLRFSVQESARPILHQQQRLNA